MTIMLALALAAACPAFVALAAEEDAPTASVMGVAGAMLAPSSTTDSSDGDEEIVLPEALKGDTDIEKATIAHDEAQKSLKAAEEVIAHLQTEIDELEKVLPGQEARSNAAMKQRYIMQSNPLAVVEPLLTSQSFSEFIRHVDYLQLISASNLREFNKTREAKEGLDSAKAKQAIVRDEVNAKAEKARSELEELQDERAERQEEGQSKAMKQAGSDGGANSVEKPDDDDDGDDGEGDEGDGNKEDAEEATQETDDLVDGADWHAHRDEFIAEWSKRLDNYLKGTPLEGHGEDFAASAWKYNIDPRWSAAISNTESSKGQFCIRPHNAWGWGAADSDPYNLASEWSSWEEAIDAHAKGLSKGYGYTISIRGAKSYCPPSWQSWYNKTLREMAKI